MKEVIVIVGTIVLGVWLVSTFFVSGEGSFRSQGTSVVGRATTEVGTID